MNNRPTIHDDDNSDALIGSAVLLLLKQNEEITSQSVLKVIRSPVFSGENGRYKAERIILDSL